MADIAELDLQMFPNKIKPFKLDGSTIRALGFHSPFTTVANAEMGQLFKLLNNNIYFFY